jgi:hypothetical protein
LSQELPKPVIMTVGMGGKRKTLFDKILKFNTKI